MRTIFVDPGALRAAAHRLEAAADILAGIIGTHLRDLQSDDAVGSLVTDVGRWSRAAREAAGALRFSADRYCDEESIAAAALR